MCKLSSASLSDQVLDVICRSYTKSNHADHECQGFDSVSFEESSSGLFNSFNNTLSNFQLCDKSETFLSALQKYRLGKQSGKDVGEGCKDGMIVIPLCGSIMFPSLSPQYMLCPMCSVVSFTFPFPQSRGPLGILICMKDEPIPWSYFTNLGYIVDTYC